MQIRFTIHTVSSLPDMYGNRYHFATITSTLTGKTLHITGVGGDSNAVHSVRKHTDAEWDQINYTQADEKIGVFNRLQKIHANAEGAKGEGELTAEDFAALEAA